MGKDEKKIEEARIIFNAIEDRIIELSEKSRKGQFNPAYQYAFEIGILVDIKEALKKINKRTDDDGE